MKRTGIIKLALIRDLKLTQGNLVKSVLFIGDVRKRKIITLHVKENILYLAAEGKYLLRYEQSPKFKRELWEFYGTGLRREIKFHFGTRAEHSRGCPLLGDSDLTTLHNTLDNSKVYEIKIINI